MVTWRGFFKFWTCTLVNSFGIDNDINITPFPTFWKSLYQHPARKFGTLCWNFLLSWSANKHFEHTQSKNYLVVPICLKNMLVKLKHLFLTSGNDKSKHVSKPPSQLIVEKTADFRNWLWYNHPTLKHNMVVIKMEHHQISMDMNGLVEVIESQELGRQRMTLPTTTKRHSPPTVVLLISWYLETFETEVFLSKVEISSSLPPGSWISPRPPQGLVLLAPLLPCGSPRRFRRSRHYWCWWNGEQQLGRPTRSSYVALTKWRTLPMLE